MRVWLDFRLVFTFCALSGIVSAQVAPSKPLVIPEEKPPQQQPAQPPPGQQQPGQQPRPGQPPAGAPAPAQPQPQPQQQPLPPSDAPRLAETGSLLLPNVSLTEMIDLLAKRLKINYILDPGVKGAVSVFTYGEVRPVDYMPLLETILRVNGAAIVKVGDWYRIVPINRVSQLPLPPQVNPEQKTIPDDERMTLNLIFLKYATAQEMLNLLKPFLGESATSSVYEPANLIIIQDNSRSMKRTMELIGIFDGDQFAGQRVRLFELENSRPTDMQKELDQIFKAYAMSDKSQAVKFLAVDRINTLIAVAPNPGIFQQVQTWIDKLDVAVKMSSGSVNSYVYRLRYARAEIISVALMALYTGNPYALAALGAMAQMQNATLGSSGAVGVSNPGMYGGGMSPLAMMGNMMGSSQGSYPYTGSSAYGQNYPAAGQSPFQQTGSAVAPSNPAGSGAQPGVGQTGEYLTPGPVAGGMMPLRGPRVIPNPFDNTLLIQATPQEYDQLLGLLRQLDVAPRQVLIEAKIYEVELTGSLSAGVSALLDQKGGGSHNLTVATSAAGVALSTGMLVSRTKELLAALSASETTGHVRVISAPSIIATDSIPATMNVGTSVPVLTSQAITPGVQQSGSSVFTNTVSNVSTGVTLSILARVNPSGIVTLVINQSVSAPEQASSNGIQSPSFSNRSFQTQLTMQDGDTTAIGGIILESRQNTSSGVPFLHRIPVLGAAFGNKSDTRDRTELIIFFTPRVIYDSAQLQDATDEIKSQLKRVGKLQKDQ
jgi:general secretion pathway protein D